MEGSVYEAAVEVREALKDAADYLGGELVAMRRATENAASRRDQWAGAIWGEYIRAAGLLSLQWAPQHLEMAKKLAVRSWELADMLAAADPRRPNQAAAAADQGDEGSGIDLSIDPDDYDDGDHGRRSK